ncbi:MAG: zinc-binding dehydrogenase [Microbacterium sp.]|uniref:zinc-binding dehydrogenase n=2 Tax=Microbacterium sp. TaxID=51671 RepID=UPI001AC3CDFB|nr:zinc-binding dehydrogenase [Microbacterium sp.]MBN9155790.1 zinc-binding dehydrogenase [Microbacterium sp.]
MTYPTISRAVVVADHDAGIEMRELAVPELAENGILVEIEAATACGTDLHIARGHMRHAPTVRPPLVLGHEMVGRIVALDAGRRADSLGRPLAEGDLIAWASPWCGNCFWCAVAHQPTLCVNANLNGFGPLHQFPHLTGGFADLAYVSPNSRVARVPEGVSAALASSATCAFRTVVHAFETVGQLRPTDSLVIQGSGAVGLYATAYAKIMGIPHVIVIGAPDERLALAQRWGASVTMSIESTTPEERLERVLHATDGRGADIVAECSGFAPAFTESLSLVRRGGRVLVVGAADPRPSAVLATNFNMRQISVSGSISADISHYWRALSLLSDRADEFDFSALLGASHGLDEVEDALQELERGAMKPIIIPRLPRSRGAAA